MVSPADQRLVLFDVKRRFADFIRLMELIPANNTAEPAHDPAVMFRSVENKFLAADPDEQLQGVWIVTDIKQRESELRDMFDSLDEQKVHFAVLGDTQSDVYLLTRRAADRQFLRQLLGVSESSRFVFV